jgi:FkbM family methyltransferase
MAKYYSQLGQDKLFNEKYFKNQKNGVFCEVGAYDGIELSNTYFFEKNLDWTGICIEPRPDLFEKVKKNRNCIKVFGGAYSSSTELEFNMCGRKGLSGLVKDYDQPHIHRINRECKQHNVINKIIKTKLYRLETIFDMNNIKVIDFITIDTEGSEYEVLKGIDFKKVHINIICIEDNYPGTEKSKKIVEYLKNNNYVLKHRLYQDFIYEHKDLKFSWEK